MILTIRLIILSILITMFIVQCSHSDTLHEIQDRIDGIYDHTCLHCDRRGIVDSMDG